MKSGVERVLIARGLSGTEIILATDGPWLACEIDNINDLCEQTIGNGWADKLPPGLYLLEIAAEVWGQMTMDGVEPECQWDGTCRAVKPEELAGLLGMMPPFNGDATDGNQQRCAIEAR